MTISNALPSLAATSSALALISASPPPSSNVAVFAQGVVQLARADGALDPRVVSRLLQITLKNPSKWTDEPMVISKEAVWKNPANSVGVTRVTLSDWAVADGQVSSTIELQLRGTPCVAVRALENAAGKRARYGGVVISEIIIDAPEVSSFRQIGDEHSRIDVTARSGQNTDVMLHARSPGSKGCLDSISIRFAARPIAAG